MPELKKEGEKALRPSRKPARKRLKRSLRAPRREPTSEGSRGQGSGGGFKEAAKPDPAHPLLPLRRNAAADLRSSNTEVPKSQERARQGALFVF
jgi:hypothetical protein